MVEPLPCLICPVCQSDTVFALRTAQMANACHCSTCGHVWQDDDPSEADPAAVELRRKPDRRQLCDAPQ
jgi:hypothetical protein